MSAVFTVTDWPVHASNNVCTAVVLCILLAAACGQSVSVVATSQVRCKQT